MGSKNLFIKCDFSKPWMQSWNVAQNVFFRATQKNLLDAIVVMTSGMAWPGITKDNGLKKKQPQLLKDKLTEATEQTFLLVPKIDQIQQILGVLYISDDSDKLKD